MNTTNAGGARAAVIAGCRTPFAKAGTAYRDLMALDLAKACVRELVERTEVEPSWIDQVIVDLVSQIREGHAEIGIAGGAESLSDVPILHTRRMAQALMEASRARTL